MGDMTDLSNERFEDGEGICGNCELPWELCQCDYEEEEEEVLG